MPYPAAHSHLIGRSQGPRLHARRARHEGVSLHLRQRATRLLQAEYQNLEQLLRREPLPPQERPQNEPPLSHHPPAAGAARERVPLAPARLERRFDPPPRAPPDEFDLEGGGGGVTPTAAVGQSASPKPKPGGRRKVWQRAPVPMDHII